MSWSDRYIPVPPLQCLNCGLELDGWRGQEGPSIFLVWQQGDRFPLRQTVSEHAYEGEELKRFSLPSTFTIYGRCPNDHRATAVCTTDTGGTWISTKPVTSAT